MITGIVLYELPPSPSRSLAPTIAPQVGSKRVSLQASGCKPVSASNNPYRTLFETLLASARPMQS